MSNWFVHMPMFSRFCRTFFFISWNHFTSKSFRNVVIYYIKKLFHAISSLNFGGKPSPHAHTPTRPQRWMKLCRKFQILAYSSWYPPFAFQFHLRVSLCKCSPIYKKAKSEDILWRASEKKIHKVDLKWMPSNRTQSLVSSFIYCKLKYIRSSVWFWEWKKKLTHFYQTDINNKTSFLFTDSAN